MPTQAASRRSSSRAGTSSMFHDGEDVSLTPAPSSLLDDPKYAIASSFMATMLHEVVIDTALLVHNRVTRQRKAEGRIKGGCPVCKTSCQRSHDDRNDGEAKPIKSETMEDGEASPVSTATTTEPNAPLPKGLEMYQNNPLLACLVCSRQVSANRYAQHLASCVGVGGKGGIARRKGKNGNIIGGSAKDRMKIKTALENRKKANFQTQSNRNTPTPSSRPEQESMSDDEIGRKSKSLADSLGLNGNGKRALSPSGGTLKKAKRSTPTRGDTLGISNPSQPFAPSALGSSLPVTGSPLNPHRNSKPVNVLDDDEDAEEADGDDDEEEEDEGEGEEDDDGDGDGDDDEDDASVALATKPSGKARNGSIAISSDNDDDDDDSDHSEAQTDDNASLLSANVTKHKRSNTQAVGAGAIERSKGSDGEYIDVESASAHSEVDDSF